MLLGVQLRVLARLFVLQIGGIAKLIGDIAAREGVFVGEVTEHGDLLLLLVRAYRAIRAGRLTATVVRRLAVVIRGLMLVIAAT